MPQPLDKVAREFRSAVLAADHERAAELAAEYRSSVAELWQSLPESSRAKSTLPEQANELLNWARGMTIVQRAMLAEQLAVLEKSNRYRWERAVEHRSRIQISL